MSRRLPSLLCAAARAIGSFCPARSRHLSCASTACSATSAGYGRPGQVGVAVQPVTGAAAATGREQSRPVVVVQRAHGHRGEGRDLPHGTARFPLLSDGPSYPTVRAAHAESSDRAAFSTAAEGVLAPFVTSA